jgi:MFS family permease
MSITFIPTLLEDLYFLEKPAILLVGSIISAGQIALAALLGWFGDCYGISRALVVGFTFVFVGMFILGFPALSLFLPLAAFLVGARRVIIWLFSSIVAKHSQVRLRGTIFGLYMALIGLGEICGPYVGGLLYEFSPTQPFFWTGTFLIFFSFILLSWDALVSRKRAAEV